MSRINGQNKWLCRGLMGKINDYVAHVYKKYADLDGSKLRTLAKKTFFSDLGFITNETIPPMKKYLKK